jgi:hypothetical protein
MKTFPLVSSFATIVVSLVYAVLQLAPALAVLAGVR